MYNDENYKKWMEKVDRILIKNIGAPSSDLPDAPYRDWYEDGMTPARAAKKAISEEW
jgi:hypothetical protein